MSTRRLFCLKVCQAASLAALSPLVDACGGSPSGPSESVPGLTVLNGAAAGRTVTVAAGAGTPLASAGGAALVQSAIGNFLVARTGQDSVSVLTAVCTHEGCTVSGFTNNTFACPCHGSRFTMTGAVANGPASSPLRAFSAQLTGDQITFTA